METWSDNPSIHPKLSVGQGQVGEAQNKKRFYLNNNLIDHTLIFFFVIYLSDFANTIWTFYNLHNNSNSLNKFMIFSFYWGQIAKPLPCLPTYFTQWSGFYGTYIINR